MQIALDVDEGNSNEGNSNEGNSNEGYSGGGRAGVFKGLVLWPLVFLASVKFF